MYASEADGLARLRVPGGAAIPEVFSVGEDHLLLEDFGPQKEPDAGFWAEFGRRLAAQHLVTAQGHGYFRDSYLGTMLLKNDWQDDGRVFFAETRMLCFLGWPKSEAVLTREERKGVERIASRLTDLVPPQGPSLCHGDLYTGNMIHTQAGEPGLIDPAVYFGMPEADLALLPLFGNVPDVLYEAYQEAAPLQPGWRERLDLLTIRDSLCMLAEYGDIYGVHGRIKAVLDRFA